jgi:hypothetical protein
MHWLALVSLLAVSNPSDKPTLDHASSGICKVDSVGALAWAWLPGMNAAKDLQWWASLWRPKHLQVTAKNTPTTATDLLDSARTHLGMPYVWGGTGKSGYDCSGFVNAVYAAHGYDLPRASRDQFQVGLITKRHQLKAGDLLFFVQEPGQQRISHVAMFVGDDEFIHAASGKGEVTYDRLSSNYYSTRFVGARRFLTLPPGRYSDASGRATKNLLFDNALEVNNIQPIPGALAPVSAQSGVWNESPGEHALNEKPPQLSSGFQKGPISKVGPFHLATDATSVALDLGIGRMQKNAVLALVPAFNYFGHGNALRVNVGIPFQVPLSGNQPSAAEAFEQGWDELQDYSKVLRELRYGQKESSLYFELSRTASGSLGHGQLMRYFTPNMASSYLPTYTLEPDALSASFDAFVDFGGFELFVDDVIAPNVIGTLVFVRPSVLAGKQSPSLQALSLALSYALDLKAPHKVLADNSISTQDIHGLGFDVEYKFHKSESLDVKAYADLSGLIYHSGYGIGGSAGVLVRTNLGERRNHVFRSRLEGRLSGPTFIPSYFDTSYSLDRHRAPVVELESDNPLTKLSLLEGLAGTAPRWGVYGEAVYHYRKRISLALAYEDGDSLGDLAASQRYIGRNLMLSVHVRDLFLPRSTKSIDFYLAFHLRNFRWSNISDTQQYFFAATSLNLSRYVDMTLSLRKAIDEDAGIEAPIDGMIGFSARYEL